MNKKKDQGFTLTELLLGLAVVAIVFSLGVPGFGSTVSKSRVTSAAADYLVAMNHVSARAMVLKQPVTLCASSDGIRCDGSANWIQGWIAFVDSDRSGNLSNTESPLKVWEGLSRDYTAAHIKYFRKMIEHSPYSLLDHNEGSYVLSRRGGATGAVAGDINHRKESGANKS